MLALLEKDVLKEFALERLGGRCCVCGSVVMIQSELSLKALQTKHTACENDRKKESSVQLVL